MYGFQGHLTKEFPSQITIDVTEYCNLACIHCSHSAFSKSSVFSGSHLDEALHEKFINEVASDGLGYCEYLRYTANGETLMHPKIDALLKYACANSKTKVNVTTNGMLLNDKKAKMLLDSGVNVVDISIDAFKEDTYSKIRVKGDLNKVRANVLHLIKEAKGSDTKVVVSFVEQPLNTNESADFKKFWEENGADFVVLRKLHSGGGAKIDIRSSMLEAQKNITRKPCVYPWERLVVSSNGGIGYCPSDWEHKGIIGHLSKDTIKGIWQGKIMESLREALLKNDFSCHSHCGNCPDWINTRWPNEGRNYANMMREFKEGK